MSRALRPARSDVVADRHHPSGTTATGTAPTRFIATTDDSAPHLRFTPSGGSPPYFPPTETLVMFNEKPMIDFAFALVVLAVLFAFVRDCRGTVGDIHGVYVQ